jgi:hypothetical protein
MAEHKISVNIYIGWPTTAACGKKCIYIYKPINIFLLPLALQPAVGFGLSNNTSPFFPIYYQLSPSSHSQSFKISFHFFSSSFPGYKHPRAITMFAVELDKQLI